MLSQFWYWIRFIEWDVHEVYIDKKKRRQLYIQILKSQDWFSVHTYTKCVKKDGYLNSKSEILVGLKDILNNTLRVYFKSC